MALRLINIGGSVGDSTGDDLRTTGDKINNNFSELYSNIGSNTAANRVLASPDNANGVPSFRSLVLRDLPTTGASTNNVLQFDGSTVVWANIASIVLQSVYPIGSLYVNFASDTDPTTALGFGTWTRVEGRVVVGKSATDTAFDTLLETGGAKTHSLTSSENGPHTHGGVPNIISDLDRGTGSSVFSIDAFGNTSSSGSGTPHNNLQPYIVASMWRRVS